MSEGDGNGKKPGAIASAWRWATTVDLNATSQKEAPKWRKIKRVMLGVFFVAGLASPTVQAIQFQARPMSEGGREFLTYALPVFLLLMVLLSPLQIYFVLSIDAINPFNDRAWRPARMESNLFDLRNPLPFIHFAVLAAYAMAAGWLLGSLASFIWFPPLTALTLVGIGIAILGCAGGWQLGYRMSLRSLRHKLPPADDAVTADPAEA
ncbi:MAG: hypothetical protein AAGK09_03465 [Planctomycetota bacterium]